MAKPVISAELLSHEDTEKLLEIARDEIPSLETLVVRNSDSLDFHDCHVVGIRQLLYRAFLVGYSSGLSKTNEALANLIKEIDNGRN